MPTRITSAFPPEVAAAVRTFRLAVLHDVIRALSEEPDQTPHELAERLEISLNSARRALSQLEDDAVVLASHPVGARSGYRVTYRVDAERVRVLVRELEQHLLAENSTTSASDE